MTLRRRRRALMGEAENKFLYEWSPSKGLTGLFIGSTSDNTVYSLTSDYLEVFTNTSWAQTYVKPLANLDQSLSFRMTVEISVPNTSANMGIVADTSWITGMSDRMYLGQSYNRLTLHGATSLDVQLDTNPQRAIYTIEVNRDTNTVSYYLNGDLQGVLAASTSTAATPRVFYVTGDASNYSARLHHILVEEL